MPDFIPVARIDRMTRESAIRFTFANGAIAVFAAGEQYFAIDDLCMRCGSSLASGRIVGTLVSCTGCGWQYNLATGEIQGVPGLRTETIETRVQGSRLLIAAPATIARR